MGKDEIGEYSPEELFDSGVQTGEDIAREQLAEQLAEQGFDDQDIQDALFSEGTDVFRPRKGRKRGKVNCSAKQRATMPQICKGSSSVRRFDPAKPKRRRTAKRSVRRYDPGQNRYVTKVTTVTRKASRKAKGILGKLKPYIMPGSAAVTFYAGYVKRTADMEADPVTYKNKDGTPVKGMMQAIMWDVNHFVAKEAMTRVKDGAVGIIAPAALGYGVKEFKLAGKYSGLAGDLLMGFAAGTAAKTILDPPAGTNLYLAQQAQQKTAAMNAAQVAAQNAARNTRRYEAPAPEYPEYVQQARQLPLYAQEN